MNLRNLLMIIALALCCCLHEAKACPAILKNLRTRNLPGGTDLCQLQNRYQSALAQLEKQGIHPAERIAGLLSIRMINRPSWLRSRDQKDHNPWIFYEPAPQTWQSWENGAQILDSQAAKNKKLGRIQPMTFDTLKSLHSTALRGLMTSAGVFRDHEEIGLSLDRSVAITIEQAQAMLRSEYPSLLQSGKNLLAWKPTLCWEDQPAEVQTRHNDHYQKTHQVDLSLWPVVSETETFKDQSGTTKQCGYVVYADPKEVPGQMDLWLQFLNAQTAQWNQRKRGADPLWVAARVQRWFITIHPFQDGNGRMSRFMMEYVLRSLGLPSPIITDFNNDLYFTEAEWAREIGQGLVRAVEQAEECVKSPALKDCKVIGDKP